MGARIEAVSALTSHGLRKPTARRLADAAARNCLEHARKEPGDIDMLINAGLYREDNMGEPALAALIQEDIGANPGQPPVGGQGTFSFDLLNGICGVISATQLEAGLLRSGVIRLGAIVTSDVHPNLVDPRSAPFRAAGGAMLLSWDDSIAGFTTSAPRRFPSTKTCSSAGWSGRSDAGSTPRGKQLDKARWSLTRNLVITTALSTAPKRRPTASCVAWGWASAKSTCSSLLPHPRTSLTP